MGSTANPIGQASFTAATPFNYIPLRTDGDDIVSKSGTVASGIGVVKRGTIVKFAPATGAITIPAVETDANAIMSNDVDATSATVGAVVYVSGKFNAAAIVWPGALSHALLTDALRNYSILIESAIYTDGTLVKSIPTEKEQALAEAVVDKNRGLAEEKKQEVEEQVEKPAVDSPWAYLTAEERDKNPELAEPPKPEDVDAETGEPKAKTRPTHQPTHPTHQPAHNPGAGEKEPVKPPLQPPQKPGGKENK